MLKYLMLGSLATIATATPASALWINHDNGTYTYVPDGLIFFVLLVAGLSAIIFPLFAGHSPPPPPKKTADEYNAEAVVMAAQRNHIAAETELRKAEIEGARIRALHQETSEIVAHDRKLRNLNAKLDEKRRAS